MDNFLFIPRAATGAFYDLLFAALTGLLLCQLWLPEANRLRKALIAASALLLLTLAAQLWVTTSTMLGVTDARQVASELRDVLTTTHAGRIAGSEMLPAAALLALAPFTANRRVLRACFLAAGALVLLRSVTGHAAANGDFTLDEALQLVHLASTAVWAGTIMIAGLFLSPQLLGGSSTVALTHFGRRVSRYATASIVLIIATGVYKSWRGLGGTLPPLVHTQWGILLTIKSTLVLLALLAGLHNRLLLQRNATLAANDAYGLVWGLRLEAVLMIIILTLSAFLANSPPAMGS